LNKLRILVITNLYPPQVIGGYERSIADFSRLLHARGHDVLVLTSTVESHTTKFVSSNTETVVVQRVLDLTGAWTPQGTYSFPFEKVAEISHQNRFILSSEIKSFQPDVCLAGNMDFLGLELIEKILADGIPVAHYVMNAHPGYAPEIAPRTSLHRYITCSDWIRDKLCEDGYPTKTAQTIYPGAAVEDFYQAQIPQQNHLRLAYASLIMPYKGADVMAEALSLLHASGVEFTATFAGSTLQPEFVQALKEFFLSEGLHERVQFAGVLSRQELKELYKSHNVLIFPSRFQEPFGISQVEAMAAGLTLVTSGTGGAKEIICHGKEGFIFESENPFDLAETLSYLPLHPDEWYSITQSGQERALSEFSQANALEKIESTLLELAAC
jgi:glycogen synthase